MVTSRHTAPDTYEYDIPTPQGPHIVRVAGPSISCPSHDLRAEVALLALGGLPCVCIWAALYLDLIEGAWGETFLEQNSDMYSRVCNEMPDLYVRVRGALLARRWRDTKAKGPRLRLALPLLLPLGCFCAGRRPADASPIGRIV